MEVISADDLNLAIRAVEAGELVVLPTRRWYMICANASDRDACDRIFAGKGRARSKSLAYMLPHHAAAHDQFIMPPYAHLLASAFWPGDLAMILPWRDIRLGRKHEPVGVPNALVTMDSGPLGELALKSQVPIAATTANISDPSNTNAAGPAITTADVQQFVSEAGIDVAYCLDGGVCPLAHHLTIVDCTGTAPMLIRSGVVHQRSIQAAITPPRVRLQEGQP
ncbi:translation factor Sua5 [Micromonospora tulbaghiae]|uniref:L-threonylcarbamoyladenylate synthase n=1 Tax=Micromonospora tulbaghiae TaxID=479978 RepID=A0A386WVK2_9ACTN|nr:Sua5/YciO/YrdC/YwlC family protein [Micromonospora tulbaghiae]AYF30434.1 translation factor Sua5 [Micromonospora tulbaghiae]